MTPCVAGLGPLRDGGAVLAGVGRAEIDAGRIVALHGLAAAHVCGKRPEEPVLVNAAAGGYIVVDSPQPFISIIDAGGHPTPLTSPRVAPLFDPLLSVDQAVRRLRQLNVRFVTFSVSNPVVNKLVQRHIVLKRLADEYVPAANLKGLLIFDLEFMAQRKSVRLLRPSLLQPGKLPGRGSTILGMSTSKRPGGVF